jgi:hypothetical protein
MCIRLRDDNCKAELMNADYLANEIARALRR